MLSEIKKQKFDVLDSLPTEDEKYAFFHSMSKYDQARFAKYSPSVFDPLYSRIWDDVAVVLLAKKVKAKAHTTAAKNDLELNQKISRKSRTNPSQDLAYYVELAERLPRQHSKYTREQCQHGAQIAAAKKRQRVHDTIDSTLAGYVGSLTILGEKFTMSGFIRAALPWLKNVHRARQNYGEYIKSALKKFESHPAVEKFGDFIQKIRAGLAKRLGIPLKKHIFAENKLFKRLSNNIYNTSLRFLCASWMTKMGCWGYYYSPDTGEVL